MIHSETNYSQSYTYTYNNYGNLVTVKVGSQTLVTYAYENGGKGDLLSITYANGDVKSYTYDIFGNTTEVRMNNALQASYLYDYNGNLYAHTETVTGETARYFEDEYGYAGYSLTFGSDGQQVAAIAEPSVELGSTTTEDIYDRLVSKALTAGDATVFTQNYTYASNGYYSSYEIEGESFSGGSAFTYTYNDLGYLTSVKENGTLKLRYTYDNLGQLTREDNAYAGKTYVYTYDNGGNILTKKTYAYTTGTVGTVESTVNYGYGNSNWKDQLTSYNGTAITYDASGNPLNWRNASAMNWTGRQLDSMTLTNGTALSFLYNSDGLRVSKTVGSNTVKYRWDGTTLLAEEHSNYTLTFLYDGDTLIGFNYGGNNYFYGIDNLGVIHYVYNEAGTVVVTYTYDAWGNTISASGDNTLISVNPIRYKSYYYDSETGLFYLQSRYYDCIIGRYINADDAIVLGVTETVLAYNLYAYCENNPVIRMDYNGHFWITLIVAGVTYVYLGNNLVHYIYNQSKSIRGYIYNQNKGNASKLYFGFFRSSYNGCGWIATYNATIMLGKRVAPADIIGEYELTGAVLYSVFGIQPYAITQFFFFRGYKVTVTYNTSKFDNVAKKNTANIIWYWHSSGAHYVALKWNGSKFIGYNTFSNSSKEDDWGKSISSFLKSHNYSATLLISISKK